MTQTYPCRGPRTKLVVIVASQGRCLPQNWRESLGLLYRVGWSRVVVPRLSRYSLPPLPPLPGAETRDATALVCMRVERSDYT
jgi:hypothetical protein